MPISVLVADAQLLFADALAEALSDDRDFAVRAERPQSAAALAEALEAEQPDVAVVDYHLDVMSAADLMAGVVAEWPAVGVVFLSRLHQPEGVEAVLDAGAAGYLPKSCAVDQLAEAIRRAYAGERPVFGEGLDRLLHDLEERRHAAHRAARRLAELTPRELEVLEWLAAGATAERIAEKLGASPQTIQTHIRNLKAKTGARTQLEAVRMGHGKAAVCLPDDALPL